MFHRGSFTVNSLHCYKFNDRFGERDVIVKFSPPIDQETGRRWADLLACEWLASEILAEKGLPFPGTTILDAGGRRFLESPRFDRTADGGRRGVVSLAALHPETDSRGSANAWRSAAAELEKGAWIDVETRDAIILLQAFGECIGNTDRHGGNLAFWARAEELPELSTEFRRIAHDASTTLRERHSCFA